MPHTGPPRTAAASAPSLRQTAADPCFYRRPSNTHSQVWLSFLWGSLSLFLGPSAHNVLFVPSQSLWRVWGSISTDCAPFTISLQFLLFLWTWVSFFGGFQHSLVNGCSAASCGHLTRKDECLYFYSAILVLIFWGSEYICPKIYRWPTDTWKILCITNQGSTSQKSPRDIMSHFSEWLLLKSKG